MTLSGRSAVIGYGRQVAEGTGLTVPKFEHVMGGGSIGPQREVAELPWTTDTQDSPGDFVSLNAGALNGLSVPALPKSVGALLHAVLGSRVTTGAGPYTHVFTPNDVLPFNTFFYAQPGGNFLSLADAKVGEWSLAWEPGQPLTVNLGGGGKTLARAGTKWGAAGLVEGVDPFFTYIGATMNFDVAASPATSRVRWIRGGSISVNRNLDMIQTDGLGYQYLGEQARSIEVSLDNAVMEDSALINQVFFGGGSALSAVPIYGSIEFTFLGSDQVVAATRSLKIALPRVLWTISEVPGADPSGNTVAYTVTGRASKPAAGASITATLINAETGSNY